MNDMTFDVSLYDCPVDGIAVHSGRWHRNNATLFEGNAVIEMNFIFIDV